MRDAAGYILRIPSEEWVRQVFDMAIYCTSLSRKWKEGQTMLFVSKTGVGEMVVGYGVIQDVISTYELSEEERRKCEEHGWKRAIEFTYVKRFEKTFAAQEDVSERFEIPRQISSRTGNQQGAVRLHCKSGREFLAPTITDDNSE